MATRILCDKRLPYPAKVVLSDIGKLIEIQTKGITYDAISGHPDVFCCLVGDVLVVSPAMPSTYTDMFNSLDINWVYGSRPNSHQYPESALYNAVITDDLLIHNLSVTDDMIKKLAGNRKQINVRQGYTRCNLLPLPHDAFITSDHGIHSVLTRLGFDTLYTNPKGIRLEGFPNGFIGGACGICENRVFIAGSLSKYKEGQKIKEFLSLHSLTPVELYDGPLFDGGSILFI
ncbi:MAG: hypothetical protein Q8908_10390 [Bacteroidota bacterium]|nr:hypothetical protein [Bacteroidota bacterium]